MMDGAQLLVPKPQQLGALLVADKPSGLLCQPGRGPHLADSLLTRLREKGLDTSNFFSPDKPIFELIEGEGDKRSVTPIFAITEVLEKVLEIGRRGVQIKRFKGLGEMNAKELFETTMDPGKRQFLRVRLDEDNAVEADKMFDVLMGDIVEPRKRFIEDNALNVRNLDV